MNASAEEGRAVVDSSLPAPQLLGDLVTVAQAGGFGAGLVEVPVPALDAVLEQRALLLDAVRYLLARTQIDPDLGYQLGPFVEAWERLVSAEALAIGEERNTNRKARMAVHGSRRGPKVLRMEPVVDAARELRDYLVGAADCSVCGSAEHAAFAPCGALIRAANAYDRSDS